MDKQDKTKTKYQQSYLYKVLSQKESFVLLGSVINYKRNEMLIDLFYFYQNSEHACADNKA